jgi:hypothetical protein
MCREYRLHGDPSVMNADEAAKLKRLLTDLDRVCAEAQEIRAKIEEMTVNPLRWPDRRATSRTFEDSAPADKLSSPPSAERNN